jgi:hypothetical protein
MVGLLFLNKGVVKMKKRFFPALILTLLLLLVVPASAVLACTPRIDIVKTTLGCDGNYDDGVNIKVGDPVTWKYVVTNKGDVYLGEIKVTDSEAGVTPAYVSGDTDGDSKLDCNETWIYTASGTAVTGDYSNTGTAEGRYPGYTTVTDTDNSSYHGRAPGININKTTNGGDGQYIEVGDPVTWRYEVTNTGNAPLSHITVTDSEAGVTPAYVSGDANHNHKLDLTETWIYTASGTAVAGEYSNTGTASGEWACYTVNDTDGSSYHNGTVTTETTNTTTTSTTPACTNAATVIHLDNLPASGVIGQVTPGWCSGEPGEEDEWHFIINGLNPTSNYPAEVTVVFQTAGVKTASFEKMSGPVAHYRIEGQYLTDKLTDAYATLPTNTCYNKFNLSHAPCPPNTTTTTTDTTVTTETTDTTITTLTTEVGGGVYPVNQFLLLTPVIALGVALLAVIGIIIRRRITRK